MMDLALTDTEAMSDTMESEAGGKLAGLPCTLVEPQGLVLDEDLHDLEGVGTMNLTALTTHLARTEVEHDEFSTTQVQFDASLICAHSSIREDSHGPLWLSKLMSSLCSSLGSTEGLSDSLLTQQQKADAPNEDWLEAHQGELAPLMVAEEFHSPNLMFFVEERRLHEETGFVLTWNPALTFPASLAFTVSLKSLSSLHELGALKRSCWVLITTC